MTWGVPLSAAEAAIYESLVVPRYIAPFADAAVPLLIPYSPAKVAQLGCRTGYPAALLAGRLPGCELTGVDNSPAALQLARTKASLLADIRTHHVHAPGLPTPLRNGGFTHALAIHPAGAQGDYRGILSELFRILAPGGQVVLALPLRGSFASLYDMLREYAVRDERIRFGDAIDTAAATRPNPETIVEQCEQAGFDEVDVCLELFAARFEHGREFIEDPISRLVVGPDVRSSLPLADELDPAMNYVAEAVARYWSELEFELRVNIGAISARKLA